MPFIPHTPEDIAEMLKAIGVKKTEDLFDEIPASLRKYVDGNLPPGLSEMEIGRIVTERAARDGNMLCFIGAGAYEHHIPAAVWDVASRGEFMTAYTPYQAEASQGTLQLIYEYQSMMSSLMGMAISNASLYDGASSLAEAILMAVRLSSKRAKNTVLIPRTVHPHYRQTVQTIVKQQNIKLVEVPYEESTGKIKFSALSNLINDDVAALIIPQPNFFGVLEDVDELTNWAHGQNILSIAVVNPMACALLKPPGQWGKEGVDIVCGEGQPLGVPLASGGPYYGFLCCKKIHVRQMPGRLVGQTVDAEGKIGYVLTMQAREQHIRRGKATSNICTNQGLLVTASTIYMALLGPAGLRRIAALCHQRTRELQEALTAVPGVQQIFSGPFFNEIVMKFPGRSEDILHELAEQHIQGGYALGQQYPELADCILICATETKTQEDIRLLVDTLREILAGRKLACLA